MIGQKFLNVGMRGFALVMSSEERQAPPPIPIVRDEIAMMRALQAEHAAVERADRTCGLVIAKPDALEGVPEGSLLETVGERFSRCLRPYDGLFVFGADRLLITLPHIEHEDTLVVMNRLCGQTAGEPLQVGEGMASATISAGGAMIDPALALQDSIDRADQALYEAWRTGGNRACLWSADLGVV